MLEAALFDAVAGLARLSPIDGVSGFGAGFARIVGPLTGAHAVARRNIQLVFPTLDPKAVQKLLSDQWAEFGRVMCESLILDRIARDPARIEILGADRLAEIASGGRPVVFVSGHFSCFELMAAAIVRAGVNCQITYRAMNNPRVDERVRRNRFRYGVRLFAPKGLDGARELMRGLERGESVALMNDQKFNGGIAAPLFGVMAHTAPGPSTFALRFGIPLQPMSVERLKGARFRVIVHDPIELADTGDREADLTEGVRRINGFVEERVRARPSEWFWVHKRWPNEIYGPPA